MATPSENRTLNATLATVVTIFVVVASASSGFAEPEQKGTFTKVKDTLPVRGTGYLIRVPENWNGILLNDLDYYTSADSNRNRYLLDHGDVRFCEFEGVEKFNRAWCHSVAEYLGAD